MVNWAVLDCRELAREHGENCTELESILVKGGFLLL